MYKIHLAGVAPENYPETGIPGFVAGCGCVFASERHAHLLSGSDVEILPVTPVRNTVNMIRERLDKSDVGVLATGDPFFFGIGRLLAEKFGSDRIVARPAVSAMQIAFSRFGESWDDAVFFSLHGRPEKFISKKTMSHRKVFCFTDRINSPSAVAMSILETCANLGCPELADSYTMMVAEKIGTDQERIVSGKPDTIAGAFFDDPNVLIIKNDLEPFENRPVFGATEDEISHSRGLITKNEARAVTLHALRLPASGVLWDIGAGSGAVSIEASCISPGLQIFAIERNYKEILNIRSNCLGFRTFGIKIIEGSAPSALQDIPDPDRVFVGGTGGNLHEIIETTAIRLRRGGIMVLNAVTDRTRNEAPCLMDRYGLEVSISDISVTRRSFPDFNKTAMNMISVITGKKRS